MTDTHTHLYLEEFATDNGGKGAVERAIANGVDRLVMPNVNAQTITPLLELATQFPENIRIAMGLHPTDLTDNWRNEIAPIEKALHTHKCVAVGEVGIDLYWDKTYKECQLEAFDYQLHLAEELNLPVIIHCREALVETLDVIKKFSGKLPQLIFHCFTGSKEDVKAIREIADPMFGIGGVVTFKNAQSLKEAVKEIGLDKILLETDSPYMAPVPHRGKRNESAYLPEICNTIAEILNLQPEEIERITDLNAQNIGLCSR